MKCLTINIQVLLSRKVNDRKALLIAQARSIRCFYPCEGRTIVEHWKSLLSQSRKDRLYYKLRRKVTFLPMCSQMKETVQVFVFNTICLMMLLLSKEQMLQYFERKDRLNLTNFNVEIAAREAMGWMNNTECAHKCIYALVRDDCPVRSMKLES